MPGEDDRTRLEDLAREYLTVHELQVLFRCTGPTLERWHADGRLRMIRKPAGHGWLIPRSEAIRVLTEETGLPAARAEELIDAACAAATRIQPNAKRRPGIR